MKPMQAVFGKWQDIQVGQLNRLLKPHGVKLQLTKSKKWVDGQVSITAHALLGNEAPPEVCAPDGHKYPPRSLGVVNSCVNCGNAQPDEVLA